jgi:predicted transcriptional regulator of viral defense system
MKYYEQLLEKGCFTWGDVSEMVGNRNSASNLIQNYLKKGYIQSVKRNLYVAINLADGEPVVNRYVIASNLTESAYISHHTALEYYGCTNQVFYDVYVSSKTRFNTFEFNGLTYRYQMSRINDGFVKKKDGTCVTDLERTIIDSINDFEKIGGLEELLRSLEMIPYIDEAKLFCYLKSYGKQFLFQETGYILEHFKDSLKITDMFFEACEAEIFKSVRYLYHGLEKEKSIYDKKWRLFVPEQLLTLTAKGGRHGN